MYFFRAENISTINQLQEQKLYLADKLIQDIDESFRDTSPTNLRSIKSAVFDIVILENILVKLGFKSRLIGDLRKIRNSLAHLDERMENFNFQPVEIKGLEVVKKKIDDTFRISFNMNFQGAITTATPTLPIDGSSASVDLISPYGMFNNYFLWIDKKGAQKFSSLETIIGEYTDFLNKIKKESND